MRKSFFACICLIVVLSLFVVSITATADNIAVQSHYGTYDNELPHADSLTASPAAITTSISTGSITALANKIIPVVFAKIRSTRIPDQGSGKNHITGIDIRDLGLSSLSLTSTTDRIKFAVTNFHTSIHAHFKHKGKLIRYSVGFTAIINNSNLGFDIILSQNNGKLVITFANSYFNAGTATIKLGGNLIKKLLNALKSLFNSKIRHAIVSGVSTALRSGLQEVSKSMAAGIELRAPISNWGSLDLAIKSISYANNAITVGFSGDVQNTAHTPSTTPRHDVSIGVPGTHTFKLALDSFVFNSLFETYSKTNQFTRTLTSTAPGTMPNTVPFVASGYSTTLPALAQKHGNAALSYKFALKDVPVLTITNGVATVKATSSMSMMVGTTSVATFDLAMTAGASVAIDIKDVSGKKQYKVLVQISQATFTFANTQTTLGPIDMKLINNILNIISNGVIVPIFNGLLIQGIPINPFIGNTGLVLKSPVVTLPANGIVVAFSLDYQVPT